MGGGLELGIVTSQCSNSNGCYPADLNGTSVPTKYIKCSNQKCVCTDCFYATNSYKSCAYQRCWEYDKTTHTCNDLRKDQRTAFLLSLFLSALGAANFYIEQNVIGGLQLATFVGVPIIIFGVWVLHLAIMLLINPCNVEGNNQDKLLLWPVIVSYLIWIAIVLMWWVADVVTFAENLSVSGDECPLKHNLGS
eukprot:Em0003g1088a